MQMISSLNLESIGSQCSCRCVSAQNRRAEYINIFMEKLVSWETVSTRLESAVARAVQREQEGTDTEDEENLEDEEPEVYLDSDVDVSEVD